MNERKVQLFVELQEMEEQGVTLYLAECPSNSGIISDAICVNEEDAYMRDYVYKEGVLKELHFDKVCNL